MTKKLLKFLLAVFLWLSSFSSYAQFKVTFSLDSNPVMNTKDSVFIAGSFNSWNPHDLNYLFTNTDGKKVFQLFYLQENMNSK